MDTNLKERWIEALMSGEYQQGRHQLRSVDNEFCCLGVLCDVAGLGAWRMESDGYHFSVDPTDDRWNGIDEDFNSDVYIPNALADHLDIDFDTQTYLQKANDITLSTFAEIAAYVRDNL